MTALFADSYFYLALLNPNDAHSSAVTLARSHAGQTITTSWIVTEVFDALCRQAHRQAAVSLWKSLQRDGNSIVIPPSLDLLERGMSLYEQRADKAWSLTDCISFVVMQEHSLQEALTGDHHFEQAGFKVLL
jgi:uncharacterized protein